MLHLLVEYANTHNLVAEPGFKPKQARWAILLTPGGRFLQVLDLAEGEGRDKRGHTFAKCPDLSFSEIKSTGGGCRHFLLDTAEVLALLGGDPNDAKLAAKHEYFVNLLRQALAAVPDLKAAADVLGDPVALAAIREQLTARKAKPTDNVTLGIPDRSPPYFVDDEACHDWWRKFRQTLAPAKKGAASSGKAKGQGLVPCLASGELIEPMEVHPQISGLADVGGQSSRDRLISFKQASFRSYGLSKSANAPVSEEMATAYCATLDHLLKHHSRRLINARVVHWYSGRQEVPPQDDPFTVLDDPLAFLDEQDNQQVERQAQHRAKQLLESLHRGQRPDLASYRYYALTLSGAAGRIMVRDWMEGPFEELVLSINAWFDDLTIVRRDGNGLAPPPKFLAVLAALVRDLKDLPPPTEARMWRVAVRREAVPQAALAQSLARAKVDLIQDEPANHARMGLLKAYHIRKGDRAMGVYLNEDHPSPAYHCGRLMALLADVQQAALGDVGAGVVQRYYAAASATPALVLGRLVRTSQFHLSKIDSPQLAKWFDCRMADVWSRICDRVPATLTLEEQSLFALGYYQQKAARRSSKENGNNEAQESPQEASRE